MATNQSFKPTTFGKADQQSAARIFKAALLKYGALLDPPLTPTQADGIVANAYRESGMNPRARQPDGSGQGLVQITGPRAHAAFASVMGVEPSLASIEQQADYLCRQFAGRAPAGYNEVPAYIRLSKTATVFGAADAFLVGYERSASAQAHDGKDAAKNYAFLKDPYGEAPETADI